MDLLAVEEVVGVLSYSLSGDLLAGEGDQGLAAALATEVVQDENSVWLKLQQKKKRQVAYFPVTASLKHQGEPSQPGTRSSTHQTV